MVLCVTLFVYASCVCMGVSSSIINVFRVRNWQRKIMALCWFSYLKYMCLHPAPGCAGDHKIFVLFKNSLICAVIFDNDGDTSVLDFTSLHTVSMVENNVYVTNVCMSYLLVGGKTN